MGLNMLYYRAQRVFLMPYSLSLVWGHLVHFAKFPILQFLKLCSSPNFHPNFIQGSIILGQCRLLLFGAICQKLKKIVTFWIFFLIRYHMQLKISAAISPIIFIGAHPNFMRTLVTIVNVNACWNNEMRNLAGI